MKCFHVKPGNDNVLCPTADLLLVNVLHCISITDVTGEVYTLAPSLVTAVFLYLEHRQKGHEDFKLFSNVVGFFKACMQTMCFNTDSL